MNILVKYEHYTSYINDNNNPYLDRKEKYRIYSKSKEFILNGFRNINEEVFDGIETKYDIDKNGDNYLILFKSKSGCDYKLELHKEPNTKKGAYREGEVIQSQNSGSSLDDITRQMGSVGEDLKAVSKERSFLPET